jgi:hypothetical protein
MAVMGAPVGVGGQGMLQGMLPNGGPSKAKRKTCIIL